MVEIAKCSSCGGEIDEDVLFRQCPRCLLDLGLKYEQAAEPEGVSLPFDAAVLLDFEIMGRIGRGGMGVVYRARQLSLNRAVALKVISGGDLASPAALARFRREAEAAAKLSHPNIVPIYEVGEHEATPFLVMRLVDGASLSERLVELALHPNCQPREAMQRQMQIARLLATVARAVHYAHDGGVLHRDLKPSNILIDAEGNPHLTDFGIAKFVDEETTFTQTSELLGTPCYMAHEQAAGKPVSRATDVYSLGVILYELLTGRRPFEGERPVEVLRKVMEEEPPAPGMVNRRVDPDLATVCLKCLDKSPSRRYASALELALDLDRWVRREPVLARPIGTLVRLKRWATRNPALATLIAGLVGGMVLTLTLLERAREEEKRKSVALAILRTETARQLQEIWASPSAFFAIKSETLAAMAGKEPARLEPTLRRLTLALPAEGNPLDRVLGAAPLLQYLERTMSSASSIALRFDLRLYKTSERATQDLLAGEVDFLQMTTREYVRAKAHVPGIQALASVRPAIGPAASSDSAVIFTRENTGIRTLAELRGKSFLFGTSNSTLTFWTKVYLAEAGVRGGDLGKYRYLDATTERGSPGMARGEVPELGNPFSEMTAVEAVVDGSYDAGVAIERRFTQVAPREKLFLLRRFSDSGLLIVARAELSSHDKVSFQKVITNVSEPATLQSFPGNPSGFALCGEGEFEAVRGKLALESFFDEKPYE